MERDIWIVRDGDGYRLLYGHLHLLSELAVAGAVFVDVRNEGTVKVVKSSGGYLVDAGDRQWPLRAN